VAGPIVEWRFERGQAGAAEIQAAVEAVLRELADPASEAAAAARAAALEPAAMSDAAVRVRQREHGAEPIVTTIVVGIAVKAGAEAVEALWRSVIWPVLRSRLGADVLGDRVDEPAAGADRTDGVGPDG
jgi:hypothetical protein